MNLIYDKFIPVCREDGTRQRIAPWQITETKNPVIRLESPRPDFNGALLQFLIGLLQTTAMPEDQTRWCEKLEKPPHPKDLKRSFGEYHFAFETKGTRGAFMQDFDPLDDQKEEPIYQLLMDFPGDNTVKQNTDHFVKRNTVKGLCPACAVTALFTLQTNAPSGGQGHRTSLRGGGPLSALPVADTKAPWPDKRRLWRDLWLNVLDKESFLAAFTEENPNRNRPEDIFPWLAPTKTSEKGESVTPQNANLLQMYWGMPRRIRILWDSPSSGRCDLCNEAVAHLLTKFKKKNYGTNYTAWEHFLSPHSERKRKNELPPVKTACKAKEGGISYQHWPDFTENDEQAGKFCAEVVARYHRISRQWPDQLRLLTFGYEMDNAKARSYHEAQLPLFHLDDEIREDFSKRGQNMITASLMTAQHLSRAIKEAWFAGKKDKRKDPPFIKNQFYRQTEEIFFKLLKNLRDNFKNSKDENRGKAVLNEWHGVLKTSALALFDYQTRQGDFAYADPKRIVKAEQKLKRNLHSKKIKDILLLPR